MNVSTGLNWTKVTDGSDPVQNVDADVVLFQIAAVGMRW